MAKELGPLKFQSNIKQIEKQEKSEEIFRTL